MFEDNDPRMKIREVVAGDRKQVHRILTATGLFTSDEIDAAMMQVDVAITAAPARDYFVYVAEEAGAVQAMISIGPSPKQPGVYDLYWIAVDPAAQGKGIGGLLIRFAESWTLNQGGQTLLIETWASDSFARTRLFYEKYGYDEVNRIKDFHRQLHDKIVYSKQLA